MKSDCEEEQERRAFGWLKGRADSEDAGRRFIWRIRRLARYVQTFQRKIVQNAPSEPGVREGSVQESVMQIN